MTKQLSKTNPLYNKITGLPNRILFDERIKLMLARARRSGIQFAVLSLSINEYEHYLQSFGEEIAHKVLHTSAQHLAKNLRDEDTLSHWRAGEFTIIISDLSQLDDISSIIQKLHSPFQLPFAIDAHFLSITLSIGVAFFPFHGNDTHTLLENASKALETAQESKENIYCRYHTNTDQPLLKLSTLHDDLINAILNKELHLHYQPQINLSDGSLVAMEAFIRWYHPTKGLILADQFIPLALDNGLASAIGTWVIREACRQIAQWNAIFKKSIRIAVNISLQQFTQSDLFTIIDTATKEYDICPKDLEIELTESILASESKEIKRTLNNLQGLGTQLSVDDVKTGYTSLWYLKQYRINKLKIDQSYVINMLNDTDDAARVYTIIRIAKSLRLKSIAKGVEHHQILELLSQHGCAEAQGNLLAHPMSAYRATFYIHSKI